VEREISDEPDRGSGQESPEAWDANDGQAVIRDKQSGQDSAEDYRVWMDLEANADEQAGDQAARSESMRGIAKVDRDGQVPERGHVHVLSTQVSRIQKWRRCCD